MISHGCFATQDTGHASNPCGGCTCTVDKKLQLYVRKVMEGGDVITTRILIAACNHFSLVEFSDHV